MEANGAFGFAMGANLTGMQQGVAAFYNI